MENIWVPEGWFSLGDQKRPLVKMTFETETRVIRIKCLLRIFIMNGYWSFSVLFLHIFRWSCNFYSSFCKCGVSCWLICRYWTILASLEWIPLDHDIWSFYCTVEFSLPIYVENFCIYIHQGYWPIIFFSCNVLVWLWYQDDAGLVKWV